MRVIPREPGAPGKGSVFNKGQIYCSLPCKVWPVGREKKDRMNLTRLFSGNPFATGGGAPQHSGFISVTVQKL